MTEHQLEVFLGFAHRLADVAGRAIRPYFRATGTIDNKRESDFDPVTAADREAEAAMRALIARTSTSTSSPCFAPALSPSSTTYSWRSRLSVGTTRPSRR
ncbi:MAG: hypothetical protein GC201_15195 [Alphaproteobacteria bacterium]|nr:hypothetical protein [Alphaproteobacteria bacterium]